MGNCFCFMYLILGIRKGVNYPMLILFLGYRQVTININKQEQSTPKGVNFLNCLLSCWIFCRYSERERQEPKAQNPKKSVGRGICAHSLLFDFTKRDNKSRLGERSTWCRLTWFPLLYCCYVIAVYLFTLNIRFLFLWFYNLPTKIINYLWSAKKKHIKLIRKVENGCKAKGKDDLRRAEIWQELPPK